MDKRNQLVKCVGPAGNTVYMPRATAESRASRVNKVRILEDEMIPVPDLSGDDDAEPTYKRRTIETTVRKNQPNPSGPEHDARVMAALDKKPRKPRGPNKKKPTPTADAN